jgi:hypothetical protein
MEEVWKLFAEEATAIQTAVALLAFVPAAISFAWNQIGQISQRRADKYRNAIGRYQQFLQLALEHPKLGVTDHTEFPRPKNELDDDEPVQRDILFDMLVSIMEEAYLAYRSRLTSYRNDQWQGWYDYYKLYCERPDFREFWFRIMGEGTWLKALDPSSTQYHRKFSKLMIENIILSLGEAEWDELNSEIAAANEEVQAKVRRTIQEAQKRKNF